MYLKNKINMLQKEGGITLIALVVTIVVLLILAGISISMLGGENGIITKAQESKEENRGGAVEERRDLWIANIKTDENTGTKTAQELDEVLLELKTEGFLSDEDIEYINENGYIEIGSHFIDFRLDGTEGEIDWSKLEPGLYETGTTKMIKSWEELIIDDDIIVYENEFLGVSQELKGDLVISNEITAIGPELVNGQCGWIQGTKVTGVYIPDTVASIGYMAFAGFKYSKNINIPSSITEISERAFYDCSSLTSIEIPNSVTSIEEYAFYFCSNLTTVKYTGTKEQWNAIRIGSSNEDLENAKIICTDGEIN